MYIFSTQHYQYLQKKVLVLRPDFRNGEIEIKNFPDGEVYHRVLCDIKDQDVAIIGGTISDAETIELYDLADGCVQLGAKSLTIVIPYFGYSTMERMVKDGEIVKAKNRALLFSAIPQTAEATKVLLFDLHSEGIPYYFNEDIRTRHIYCKPIIKQTAQKYAGNDFVLASTDAGRAKWIESLAMDMNVDAAFIYKKRLSGSDTEINGINADVQNKIVVIYDDMIRTGSSLLNAAKAYKEKGAKEIFVLTTHGLFTNNALQKIEDSGLIKRVFCTDSHPNALIQNSAILEVGSVAELIAFNLV